MANELLRQHVTRVGFNLQLTKSQVAALIYLDVMLVTNSTANERIGGESTDLVRGGGANRILSHFVTPVNGLIGRGLVTHIEMPPETDERGYRVERGFAESWTITAAGRIVIELLKQAGIWQEVAEQLQWTQPPPQLHYSTEMEAAHLRERIAELTNKLVEERAKTTIARRERDLAQRETATANRQLGDLRWQVRRLVDFDGLREAIGPDPDA